jgi:DNA-binding NtrC family response regulator
MLRHRQIVVAGPDRRFLRVAAFFLARRGHEVATTADADEAIDLIGRHDADVAIVDGNTEPTAALQLADDIETHYPSVATLVVADEPAEVDASQVPGKWRVVRRLLDEIERGASPLTGRGKARR